ncbi:MAG: nucleoside hydrolase [Chloroflexi bacterium]|nr:nucleoside hydrolase [Chloroflexota bacterium]
MASGERGTQACPEPSRRKEGEGCWIGSKAVLIDTDPGTDDFIAILMALRSPALQVLGITTVGGNARLAHCTRNALRVLEHASRADVPVAPGARRPLQGAFHYAYDFHGPGGLTVRLPRPSLRPSAERAEEFMARKVVERPGDVTLVALGPLTNVARLLERRPEAARRLRGLVVMGGALSCPGNVTPYAEFNFHNDPEAARRVLNSGLPITLVPLDACRQATLGREELRPYLEGGPDARFVGRLLAGWFRRRPPNARYDLCDPLAMAVAVDPAVMPAERRSVSVETQDRGKRGMSRVVKGNGAVAVPSRVDVQGFFGLLKTTLGALGANENRPSSPP